MALVKKKKTPGLTEDKGVVNQQGLDLPKPVERTPTPQTTVPEIKPSQPQVIRDQDTGKVSGVTLPDGRTILGNEKNIKAVIEKRFNEQQTPQGAVEGKQIAQNQNQIINAQEAANKLGQQVQPNVDLGQSPQETATNLGLNAVSIAGGVTGGAGVGAAAGAALGTVVPGIGNVVGGVAGGIIGGVVGGIGTVSAKISLDRRQATKEAFTVYKSAVKRDTELINLANSGMVSPDEIQLQYDLNLANLRASEAELKKQTRGAVNKQLSGAMDELIQVQAYLNKEGERRTRLAIALQAPNPNLVYSVAPDTAE